MKVEELLDCNWVDFNENLHQFNKPTLIKALNREQSEKGKNRKMFIARMQSRLRQIAYEEASHKYGD